MLLLAKCNFQFQALRFFLELEKILPADFLLAGAGVPPAALAAVAAPAYFNTNF